MDGLTRVERELVALGAALGSNCVPCIERHVPEARKVGLSDGQINEAIRLADKIRQAPARKVLDTALGLLSRPACASETRATGGKQSSGADAELAATQARDDDRPAAQSSTDSSQSCCG
jgi:AhpD family alkylhydroperoxidase